MTPVQPTTMEGLSQRLSAKMAPLVSDIRRRHQPLYLRFKNHYDGHFDTAEGHAIEQKSRHFAAFFLWFMAITTTYTSLKYTVPHYIGEVWGFDSWIVYWMKVVIVYGAVQIGANWTCVRCYTSYHEETEDRPELIKTLWDEHPMVENAGEGNNNKKHDDIMGDNNPDGGSTNGRDGQRKRGWGYCAVCQLDRPPRAHHCKVCRKCTLKRDHHCFIVGACIGYYNQRYFVVFCFYLMMYSGICLFLAHTYFRDFFYPTAEYSDFILPVAAFKWLISGTIPLKTLLLLIQVYTFVWTGPMCTSFFVLQLLAIAVGRTMHEFNKGSALKVTSGFNENFRQVFGAFWPVNFIFPAVILFRQQSDGTSWPKVIKLAEKKKSALTEVKTRAQ